MCHTGVIKREIVSADSLFYLLYQGVPAAMRLRELSIEHLFSLADEFSNVGAQMQGDIQMLLVIASRYRGLRLLAQGRRLIGSPRIL